MSNARLATLAALVVREKRWLLESGEANDPESERHDNINALEFAIFLAVQDKLANPSCYADTSASQQEPTT